MAFSTLPPLCGFLGMSLLPNTPEYKWTKWGMFYHFSLEASAPNQLQAVTS